MIARLQGMMERFAAALTDPARRERSMIALLLGYVAIWTTYGVVAKGGQDLHPDMTEIADWSRDLAHGYAKHPPLAPYLTRVWFTIFPSADWSFYLFAVAIAGLSLWIAWRAALRYLDPRKAVAATLLLTFIPFFNFHALKFNANTVLMPLWAVTTLWFLISFETRSRVYAALAGIAAGAAVLGKYWSVFLLIGLVCAALIDRRRAEYFRSAAPYLTVVAGALVIAPHVVWLYQHDYAPFRYAAALHGAKSFGVALSASLGYLAGAAGYAIGPALFAVVLLRMDRKALADAAIPQDTPRRMIAMAFWLPLLLPALLAPLGGTALNSIWSMSAWTLFGVVLLISPRVAVTERALAQLLACAIAFPLVATAAAPAIAYIVHRNVEPWQTHTAQLANEIDRFWAQSTPEPLRIICGDAELAFGAAFYSASRAPVCDDLAGFAHGTMKIPDSMARKGMAIVCSDNKRCALRVAQIAGPIPLSRQHEVELSRHFMGSEGPRERYLIVVVPPRK